MELFIGIFIAYVAFWTGAMALTHLYVNKKIKEVKDQIFGIAMQAKEYLKK